MGMHRLVLALAFASVVAATAIMVTERGDAEAYHY